MIYSYSHHGSYDIVAHSFSTQDHIMSDACFDNFNNFLLAAVGTAEEAISSAFDEKKKVRHAFFKPYKDPSDFFIRAVTIASAPIACAVLAIEALAIAIFCAFDALVELCRGNTNKATGAIKATGVALLGMLAAVLTAFISPLVNLIDLIGGGVATIGQQCNEEAQLDPGYY